MDIVLILILLLVVAWFSGVVFIHLTGFLIHFLLVIAAVLLVVWLYRKAKGEI
jgi:hypothetical protein